jgi:hypothetical protein
VRTHKILLAVVGMLLMAIFVVANMKIVNKPQSSVADSSIVCKFDGHNYLVKEKDGVWRGIILPHTELGYTAQTVQVMEDGKMQPVGDPIVTETKIGRPLLPSDVGESYKKNVKVHHWYRVEDGNYCVEKTNPEPDSEFGPLWTVWSKELFEEVRQIQGW